MGDMEATKSPELCQRPQICAVYIERCLGSWDSLEESVASSSPKIPNFPEGVWMMKNALCLVGIRTGNKNAFGIFIGGKNL